MAEAKSLRDVATSARRTGGVRRTENVGTFTPTAQNLDNTNIQAEKKLSGFEKDLERLNIGAKQAIGAVYEASEWADKIRSNDTYTNYIAGMQNINKFYSDKMAKGGRLSSKDLADKKEWQNNFYQSMMNQAVAAGDDTNQIFKSMFVDPATEHLMKTNANDTQNQFQAIKFETQERNSNMATKLSINIKGDNFKQFLSDGKRLGINNYGETISADVAQAHIAEIVAGETNATVPQTTMEGLVAQYTPNALSYDANSGQFTRGQGFEDLSDEAYKSMIQALNVQLNKNTAGLTGAGGAFDRAPYDRAYGNIEKTMNTYQTVTDEQVKSAEKEATSLMQNSAFTTNMTKTSGIARVRGLENDAQAIAVHNSKVVELQGFFNPDGSVIDPTTLMARVNEGSLIESKYGNIIEPKYVRGVIEQKTSALENSLSGINFDIENPDNLKQQLSQVDSMLSVMWKNDGYREKGHSPIFKRFEDEEMNPKGNMGINEALIYSRYVAVKEMYNGKVSTNLDTDIQRIVEQPEVPMLQKVRAVNRRLQSHSIMRGNEVNRASRLNVIKDTVEDHLKHWITADSEPADGTVAAFNQILPNANAATIKQEIEGRDTVRIGTFGMTTKRDDYVGAVLWKGADVKKTNKFVSDIVSNYNKGKVDTINEDDLDVFATTVNTPQGTDIAYEIRIMVDGQQRGQTVLMSKQTVDMGWAVTTEKERTDEYYKNLDIMP